MALRMVQQCTSGLRPSGAASAGATAVRRAPLVARRGRSCAPERASIRPVFALARPAGGSGSSDSDARRASALGSQQGAARPDDGAASWAQAVLRRLPQAVAAGACLALLASAGGRALAAGAPEAGAAQQAQQQAPRGGAPVASATLGLLGPTAAEACGQLRYRVLQVRTFAWGGGGAYVCTHACGVAMQHLV
jgi:hypothetical protein